ncbi:ABC transporter permease [Propioniciclava flava]|uniref:ABC transporter permease n=2 Tax=Propioniciclava flava TaxID=2072026 RepID=A0A4Q2EKE2_9ACTN|nr:ABC transporter permease [Propioniciclava flava]
MRVVLGLSRTLTVMILATGLSALAGGLLGMIAGYLGGPTRALIMLATDLVLIVPTFVGALIFAALFGLTPVSAGIVLGLFGIGPYVNQACALTEAVRGRAFLQIETLLGTPTPVIVARHIAPAVMRPLAVYLGASAANAVLAYAGLAFIGLGVDTTLPDWGTMLYDYRVHLSDHPLLVLWPTLGIAILALSAHAVFDEAEGETP